MKHKLKRTLAGLLTATLLICPVLAASFPDVDDAADYAEAVECVSDIGFMVGDDLGNFNPNKPVTRAEMATIICRMLDETEGLTKSSRFTDVPMEHWANPYVAKAAELGIVGGYGDGRFGPADMVTYEQVLAMVIRAVGLQSDAQSAGGYPDGYVYIANSWGYTEGISATVGNSLVRWQVALILYNVMINR